MVLPLGRSLSNLTPDLQSGPCFTFIYVQSLLQWLTWAECGWQVNTYSDTTPSLPQTHYYSSLDTLWGKAHPASHPALTKGWIWPPKGGASPGSWNGVVHIFPLCVSVSLCPNLPLLIRTSFVRFQAHPAPVWPHFNALHLQQSYFQIRSYSELLCTYEFLRDAIQPRRVLNTYFLEWINELVLILNWSNETTAVGRVEKDKARVAEIQVCDTWWEKSLHIDLG